MLYYLVESRFLILWFFSFPFTGLLLKYALSKKALLILLIISGLFTIPILLGYSYILSLVNEILFFTTFSLLFAYFSKSTDWKYSLKFSSVLFVFLGIVAFFTYFIGNVKTTEQWSFRDYKIELLEERGFSGGPLMRYRLSEYKHRRVFIKELEFYTENDSTPSCEIKFPESNFIFNKCNNELKKNVP
jgi:hypothetical protein